ncbi:neurotactin isoform X2 [Macrobrachium rosenbergii]|uniref:neurotactin isoform X2 n=1 Tax=Macrobrachium rosenbergii TaxID=79674 RepID=UPI0034D4143F
MFGESSSHPSYPMSGVPVVGRYVARSWSSGSGTPRGEQHPQPAPQHRSSRGPWRLPAFFRRKFEIAQRGGGRVGSTVPPGVSEGGVAVTEEAFKDPSHPSPYKDPLKDPLRDPPSSTTDPLREFGNPSSPYAEPEHRDVGYREPRYLDLFDPGVSVVRDPKLDQPSPPLKNRTQTCFSKTLTALASTRVIIVCSILLVVLVIVIAVIASSTRGIIFGPDPRVKHPYVTTVTACGPVQGVVEDDAYVFRGVPYAIPPVGKFRFRHSQLQTDLEHCWSGTYMANITRPCWGYDMQGAVVNGWEDCLLLDIFTPQLGYDSPLPVVVYVGGSSLGGDTRRPWLLSKAAPTAIERGVVIVAPQIRRGIFGFFPHPTLAASTYPHTAGNQGVSDLLTALAWVHHNIEHFGGDPHRVTLLGHQAGAALAWPLLYSSQGHRYIHTAWMSGAAPLHPERTWRDADPSLVESLNCTSLRCLEMMPAQSVMEAPPLEWRRPQGQAWLVSDGVVVPFIPSSPQVPIMIGSTEQAAAQQMLAWRERLGASRQQLVDAVIDGLRLPEVAYRRPPMGMDGQDNWMGGSQPTWPGRPQGDPTFWPMPPSNDPTMWSRRFPGGNQDTWPRYPGGSPQARWPQGTGGPTEERRDPIVSSTAPGMSEAETALEWYSTLNDNPWLLLTTLISDGTVTCPALLTSAHLARARSQSHNVEPKDVPIYSYVSRYPRVSRVGALADGLTDIEAILGVFRPLTRADARYARKMQDLFFVFVETGSPEWYTSTPAHLGVYMIDEDVNVEGSRIKCDHWVNMTYIAGRY